MEKNIKERKLIRVWKLINVGKKVRAMGFEPTTVGFGVQRSTVGATPSPMLSSLPLSLSTQSSFIMVSVFLGSKSSYNF